MTTATLPAAAIEAERASGRRGVLFWLALAVCVAVALAAIIGPFFAPYPPQQTNLLVPHAGPSAAHLLGTDALGRDLLSRALYGARLSLLGPALVVLIASIAGVGIAVAAAWLGGWADTAISRVIDVMFAFPSIIIAVLAVAIFGVGFKAPVVALAIAYIPYLARPLRSVALREVRATHVEVALLAGLSGWRVCRRHVLPAIVPLLLAQATIAFGAALVDLGAISFIGLGVQPPTAEWGLMIADGWTSALAGYPEEALVAGSLMVITIAAFTVLGERLASRSEPGR
jgi:peptide/nickel transport system permease protein